MATDLTSLTPVLKQYYFNKVVESLNNETLVHDFMSKPTLQWNGYQAVIPVHVGGNSGIGTPTNNTLPTAGEQSYVDLIVAAKRLFGTIEIDGLVLAAAENGSLIGLANAVDSETKGLKTDIMSKMNSLGVSGGTCIGYISESSAGKATANTWIADLDWTKAALLLAQAQAIPGIGVGVVSCLRVSLVQMDDYSAVAVPAAATAIGISALNAAAGTVTLVWDGGANLVTNGVTAGNPIAVMVEETTVLGVVSGATTYDVQGYAPIAAVAGNLNIAGEAIGIFGNLSLPTHFTADRTTATGYTTLQSTCMTCDSTSAARAPLNTDRLQYFLDSIEIAGNGKVEGIFLNHRQRAKYQSTLLNTTVGGTTFSANRRDISGKPGVLDGGASGYAYNGIPFMASKDIPNGMLIALDSSDDAWKFAEHKPGDWANNDGNVLSRKSGSDAWQAYWRHYYNTVCAAPNRQGVLAGLSL